MTDSEYKKKIGVFRVAYDRQNEKLKGSFFYKTNSLKSEFMNRIISIQRILFYIVYSLTPYFVNLIVLTKDTNDIVSFHFDLIDFKIQFQIKIFSNCN